MHTHGDGDARPIPADTSECFKVTLVILQVVALFKRWRERGVLKRLTVIFQVILGALLLFLLIHAAGLTEVTNVIYAIDAKYLALAFIASLMASIAYGLMLIVSLKAIGMETNIFQVLLASLGGQLLADVTPARSGYLSVPFILKKTNGLPIAPTMACIISIQSVAFFVKSALLTVAIPYIVLRTALSPSLTYALLFGFAIVLAGGIVLAFCVWSKSSEHFLRGLLKVPFIGRLIHTMSEAFTEFQRNGQRIRRSIPLIAVVYFCGAMIFSAGLYPIGLALGITQLTFLDYIFLGPLVSALGFVPLTAAGLGLQEGAYTVILVTLGTPFEKAVLVAVLARILYTAPDLIGLPTLVKTGGEVLSDFVKR